MSLKQKWGQWEDEAVLCPYIIFIFKAVLCHITTVWPHCTTSFEAWMECFPTVPSSTNPLCSRGAVKVLRCPFLLQCSGQWSFTGYGRKNRALDKANLGCTWDVLRHFGGGYYRKSRPVFAFVLKLEIPTECYILWFHQSIFLFKHGTVLVFHFQFHRIL